MLMQAAEVSYLNVKYILYADCMLPEKQAGTILAVMQHLDSVAIF